jgi:hypothetical protein
MRKSTRRHFDSSGPDGGTAEAILISDDSAGRQVQQDGVRDYIASMALELSALAKEQDAGFLAYLLGLAVAEAKAVKARVPCAG